MMSRAWCAGTLPGTGRARKMAPLSTLSTGFRVLFHLPGADRVRPDSTALPGAASGFQERPMADSGGIAADHLKSFIERIERLEEENAAIAGDIKEVYAEAKGNGFDTKIMRQIVRLRKMEPNDRAEQEELLDVYMRAVGMVV
jgi:uncharacterized protein (UPF0335 family)